MTCDNDVKAPATVAAAPGYGRLDWSRLVNAICSVAGCARTVKARGWCHTHYERQRLGRDMDVPIGRWARGGSVCAAEGCDRPVHAHGWCGMHGPRVRRHGDPNAWTRHGAGSPRWAGENVGYHGAHKRVYALRGSAATHTCVDCSGPAAQWSYDLNDPDERSSHLGPFSLNADHYEPRCVPCHKSHDVADATARGWTVWNKGPETCSVTDCGRKAHARGWCSSHYNRWYNARSKR